MAKQTALITAWTGHDRGISVGVRACHQNSSASDRPLSVGLPSARAPGRSAATGLSGFGIDRPSLEVMGNAITAKATLPAVIVAGSDCRALRRVGLEGARAAAED